MALPIPTDSKRPNWNPYSDSDDWEICNDNGFVYKRRRRSRHLQPSSSSADSADAASLRRHRRARKRRSLLSLKEKYSQELNHWKFLSSSSSAASAAAADVGPTSTPTVAPPLLSPAAQPEQQPVIDELLLQAETQEAVLRKLSELCDYVDSVCDAEEEIFAKELADLPIWGSPKALVSCLQSL